MSAVKKVHSSDRQLVAIKRKEMQQCANKGKEEEDGKVANMDFKTGERTTDAAIRFINLLNATAVTIITIIRGSCSNNNGNTNGAG